jgi:DNA invertase Pin-like site-specific DNA recombinase
MTSTNSGSVIAMPRRMRCAVYTRKSSEEGLDMEFNSLDAQREACEAYIRHGRGPQRHQRFTKADDAKLDKAYARLCYRAG